MIRLAFDNSKKSSKECEAAFHVYAALGQYQAQNLQLADDEFFNEAMASAHANWAALFARDEGK